MACSEVTDIEDLKRSRKKDRRKRGRRGDGERRERKSPSLYQAQTSVGAAQRVLIIERDGPSQWAKPLTQGERMTLALVHPFALQIGDRDDRPLRYAHSV